MGYKKGSGTSNRYRLSSEEASIIDAWREKGNLPELLEQCKESGIPLADVRHYWHKSERFSIFAKHEEKSLEDTFEPILEEIRSFSPKFKKINRKPIEDPHCLVIDPADVHVGKLSVLTETGESYDIDTAVAMVDEAVDGILSKAAGFNLDKIMLVIGNDCLHIDSPTRRTTAGTPQDTSGMWHEAFIAAKDMYNRAIEKLLPYADVHVTYNPSNHDYMSGFMLAQCIEAFWRKHKNVTFDVSISHRKYFQYGTSLIGTSHGDGARMADMPLIMAQESGQKWVDCPHRYIYLHHIHHKQIFKFMAAKDQIGVTIEYLRSPSATDGWHDRNGYIGAKKAIEGFIHSKDRGRVATLAHLF